MSNTNVRSLRTVAAGAALALVVVTALSFARDESIARDLRAPKVTAYQNANLGDALPGTLGSGIAPNLW
jgi:hypothetical protein